MDSDYKRYLELVEMHMVDILMMNIGTTKIV